MCWTAIVSQWKKTRNENRWMQNIYDGTHAIASQFEILKQNYETYI
jgi:hypothetical protein